jgi:cardiolipin synthase
MFHCKVLIVDGLLVSVGSTNVDNRSMRLDDEATLNVLDANFAKVQTDVFEADLRRAVPYSHEKWLQRPWTEKASEQVVHLFGSQL